MRQSAARDKMTNVAGSWSLLMTETGIRTAYDPSKINHRTKQMIYHKRTLEIDACPEAIWAILSRFMQIDEIAPQVAQVQALTHGSSGVGSKRRCYFKNGSSLVEEVTKWEPNSGYSVRLSEISAMPLTEAHVTIVIEPIAGNRAKVTWSMEYAAKHGPIGWLLGQTLIKMMVNKVLGGNLKALNDKVSLDPVPDGQPAFC